MSLTIVGVHHIAIQVDDLDPARRFYREVMGLAEIADRPDFEVDGACHKTGLTFPRAGNQAFLRDPSSS